MNFACPKCGEENATYFPEVPCTSFRSGAPHYERKWCCEICQYHDENQLRLAFDELRLPKAIKDAWNHYREFHRRLPPATTHKGNGAHMGPFAFTLTFSPNDDLTEEDMIAACRKVMGQRSCPVVRYAWYLEYGDKETKSHPHIHGMYETRTGGRIEAKHWKRAWPIWDEKVRMGAGFRGGYHRPVKDGEAYESYIEKDAEFSGVFDTLNKLIEGGAKLM